MNLRLLCRVGAAGRLIKEVAEHTGCTISINNPEKVISITGDAVYGRLISINNDTTSFFHSMAQEGLLRAYERVLEGNQDGRGPESESIVCRLLCRSVQIKAEEGLPFVHGAKIEILNKEDHPPCAGNNDELIQKTGRVLPVKRALLLVSERLQKKRSSGVVLNEIVQRFLQENPAFDTCVKAISM